MTLVSSIEEGGDDSGHSRVSKDPVVNLVGQQNLPKVWCRKSSTVTVLLRLVPVAVDTNGVEDAD